MNRYKITFSEVNSVFSISEVEKIKPTEYFELIHSDDIRAKEKAMKNALNQKKMILSELK